ncbi:MAG: hypothetical protein AAF545_15290, partial [Pseudomonadota bacterium]
MDLSAIRFNETTRADLYGPEGQLFDDDGGEMYLSLASLNSRTFAEQAAEWRDRLVEKAESAYDYRMVTLALATTGGNVQDGGAKLELTPETAYDLYQRHPWVAAQARHKLEKV